MLKVTKQYPSYKPIPQDDAIFCVMCSRPAFYYAPETGEPLCNECCRRNDEARHKK